MEATVTNIALQSAKEKFVQLGQPVNGANTFEEWIASMKQKQKESPIDKEQFAQIGFITTLGYWNKAELFAVAHEVGIPD